MCQSLEEENAYSYDIKEAASMIMNKNYLPQGTLGGAFKLDPEHAAKHPEIPRFDEESFNLSTNDIVIPNIKRGENFAPFSGTNSQDFHSGIFNQETAKNFGIHSGLGKLPIDFF